MGKKYVFTVLGLIGTGEKPKPKSSKPYLKSSYDILWSIQSRNKKAKPKYYYNIKGEREENKDMSREYYNMLPLLIDDYVKGKGYEIRVFHTKETIKPNSEVLDKSGLSEFKNIISDENFLIAIDEEYSKILNLIDNALDEVGDGVIVDLTHGFRHLPILMMVDLIMQNFRNINKIDKILYAKEMESRELYEIIDLKEYLELANMSFILGNFKDNYTISNHIKSKKHAPLIDALNAFSNDIMAQHISNLKTSGDKLCSELEKVTDESLISDANELSRKISHLVAEDCADYLRLLRFSKDLFAKNYILLALTLLFESIRTYIVFRLGKENEQIMKQVKEIIAKGKYPDPSYSIADLCASALKCKPYDFMIKKFKTAPISKDDYEKLMKTASNLEIDANFYNLIDKRRNNLAHANSGGKTFSDVKNDVGKLLMNYSQKINSNLNIQI